MFGSARKTSVNNCLSMIHGTNNYLLLLLLGLQVIEERMLRLFAEPVERILKEMQRSSAAVAVVDVVALVMLRN
jgi:hypothetical protein